MSDRVIRASEIGQYDFCAKAWWLNAVQGIPSTNVREMQFGAQMHEQHGRRVSRAGMLQQVAILILIVGVIILAMTVLNKGL